MSPMQSKGDFGKSILETFNKEESGSFSPNNLLNSTLTKKQKL